MGLFSILGFIASMVLSWKIFWTLFSYNVPVTMFYLFGDILILMVIGPLLTSVLGGDKKKSCDTGLIGAVVEVGGKFGFYTYIASQIALLAASSKLMLTIAGYSVTRTIMYALMPKFLC